MLCLSLKCLASSNGKDLKSVLEICIDSVNDSTTHPETDLPEFPGVDQQTTVKDESWLVHLVVDSGPVYLLEFRPFRGDDDRFGTLGSVQYRVRDGHRLLN
jgi:hypothetical protein